MLVHGWLIHHLPSVQLYPWSVWWAHPQDITSFVNNLPKSIATLDVTIVRTIGNVRNCFNYLLIDPRVTAQSLAKTRELQKFRVFVEAIFYIGRGKEIVGYSTWSMPRKVS